MCRNQLIIPKFFILSIKIFSTKSLLMFSGKLVVVMLTYIHLQGLDVNVQLLQNLPVQFGNLTVLNLFQLGLCTCSLGGHTINLGKKLKHLEELSVEKIKSLRHGCKVKPLSYLLSLPGL